MRGVETKSDPAANLDRDSVEALGNALRWEYFEPPGDELRNLCSSPPSAWKKSILRETPHRSVYRVLGPGAGIIVKEFRRSSLWKSLFFPSRAQREASILRRLSAADFPVPKPLAIATSPEGTEYLFLGDLGGRDLLETAVRNPQRFVGLDKTLGRLLRELHDFGLRDPDRHAGNFLVDDAGRLWALDFHSAQLGPPLTIKERMHSLAMLNANPAMAFRSRFRCGVLSAYGNGLLSSWGPPIEEQSRAVRRKQFQRKTKQAVRSSRRFEQVQIGRFRGFCRRTFSFDELRKALALFESRKAAVMKQGRRTLVTAVAAQNAVIKAYFKHDPVARARTWLGWGRARRAWKRAFFLELNMTHHPESLALLEGPDFDLLISRRAEFCVHPSEFLSEFLQTSREKAKLIAGLADLISGMHRAGLRGRDFREENFLVSTSSPAEVQIVDYDGLHISHLGWREPWKDLGRLAASFPRLSVKDGCRFLKTYQRGLGPGRSLPGFRTIFQSVRKKRDRIQARWHHQADRRSSGK